jgi:hypothetical protein
MDDLIIKLRSGCIADLSLSAVAAMADAKAAVLASPQYAAVVRRRRLGAAHAPGNPPPGGDDTGGAGNGGGGTGGGGGYGGGGNGAVAADLAAAGVAVAGVAVTDRGTARAAEGMVVGRAAARGVWVAAERVAERVVEPGDRWAVGQAAGRVAVMTARLTAFLQWQARPQAACPLTHSRPPHPP